VDFVGEEQRIGKTLGTDLATGKLTLPLMLLLERVNATEREALVAALRSGQGLGLTASKQRMQELNIAAGVVQAIEAELAAAGAVLAPFARLAPVPLMLQLGDMLRQQVAALSMPAARG